MAERAATLTLQDIADLAKVRRPVVSMWRKRQRVADGIVPFPQAVRRIEGIEHFDREAVADYLRRTGRGRSPDFDLDAPAGTVPDDVHPDELVILLCLRVALGEELTSAPEKAQMAAAYMADPGDRFLAREVLALKPESATLEYMDELYAAALGPAEALDRLDRSRVVRRRATRGLSAGCIDLVAAVAHACTTQVSEDVVPLEYVGGDPDLAVGVARHFTKVAFEGDDSEVRDLRRRAFIRGIEQTRDRAGRSVKLVSVVDRSDAEALEALDDVVLELDTRQVAVVIGAASALSEGLIGEAEQRRSEILRSRSLACALRLRRGQWRGAHRQALAIWVCAGAADVARPMAADLEAFAADELDLDDLSSDVAGCLTVGLDGGLVEDLDHSLRVTSIRSFRYLRPHRLSDIHGGRPVVPRGIRAERLGTSASQHRDRVIEQSLLTSVPAPSFDVAVADAPPTIVVVPRSLGDLTDHGLVVKRGSRIDMDGGDPNGTVEVWSGGGPTGVRYDPIVAERHYPRAVRTEPGDVVFDTKPRPRATVEARGGALVASPARILRLADHTPMRPYTLAAAINLPPEGLGDWQAWPVPSLRLDQGDALEVALRGAATYEDQMRTRLEAVRRLQHELIAGVVAGAITVEPGTNKITVMKENG